jgi:5-formyltetrahydrofolate cyclo-ligase
MNNKSIKEIKNDLRAEIMENITALPKEYTEYADRQITKNLIDLPEYKIADTVFCFVGTEHEINTKPFLLKVLADGKRLAVPLCTGKGTMEARRIDSLEQLKRGYFGLFQPERESEIIPISEIGLSVIPCLTTDLNGNRLGYGGGYYDILFNKYSNATAAIICRRQIVKENIPIESFDRQFKITVTENGVYRY